MSILIKNGLIVPQTGKKTWFTGDIYVDDFIISEISTTRLTLEADVVIDASEMIILPGLINTHTHVPMTLLRGYGDDMLLHEWLSDRIWPVEARLNKEYIEVASKLAFLEMIASGTTTFLDMYFFEETIANVALEAGMRAALGFALIDAGTPEYSYDQLFHELQRFINKWKKQDAIYPVIAPHGTYTCGVETLEKVSDLADRHNVLIHTHCSETRDEIYDVMKRYGVRPIEQLKKCGLLNEHMILAHCGWITKNEIFDMAKTGVKVSHCPVSNMKIATGGYAPIPELLQAEVPVSLGTDGAASNNTLDMFDTMKMTALVHKQHRWDPQVMPSRTVLDSATLGGAVSLGLSDKIGSIKEEKIADIICINTHSPHLTPCHDPISNLVYAANGSDVCTTIANGKLLYHNNEFLTLSKDEILEQSQIIAKDLTSLQ